MAKLSRREFVLSSGAAGLAAPLARPLRAAEAFPERDIAFVIPYGPGGGFDTYARVVAPAMEKYLPGGIDVVPTNIATAGGGKALTQLARTRPDGYTIGVFPIPGALILQDRQNARGFNLHDFTWLGRVGPGETYAIGVREDSPLRSIADMQALSRTRQVSFTCTGPDGTSYMATVISCHLLGIASKYITGYAGSNEYIVAAIRGDADAVVAALSTMKRFQGERGIRILATFEETSSISGVPGAMELGTPELSQIIIDRMVAAPPGLSPERTRVLTSALDRAVRDPDVLAWAASVDIPWAPNPAGQADALFTAQAAFFEKWKPLLTES